MKKLLFILFVVFLNAIGFSQGTINKAEYFIDTDPGFGNGTAITITPAILVNTNFNVNLSVTSAGIHFLYIRALSDSGWSSTLVKPFLIEQNGAATILTNITQLEYFYDTDPGFGNGTIVSITPSQVVNFNFTAGAGSLTSGLHILHIRAKDANGIWSLDFARPVIIKGANTAPNITQLEYYFDADPGYGNGTSLNLTTGSTINQVFNVNLNTLNSGLHILHIRSKDFNNVWSLDFVRPIIVNNQNAIVNINKIEYFFDADPGFGNGIQYPIAPISIANENSNLNLTGLTDGLHILYIRAQDDATVWSETFTRPIIVKGSTTNPNITAIEYFIDTDPGYGNATLVSVTPSAFINRSFAVSLTSVTDGIHLLSIRAKNQNGVWGETLSRVFVKSGQGAQPNITYLEYFVDSTPKFGTGISVPIVPNTLINDSFIVNLTGHLKGNHTLYLATKDANNNWSLVSNKSFCIGPQADFSTDTVCESFPTTFIDLSLDTMGVISYSWDFDGDGISDNFYQGDTAFVYPLPGTYNARLIVDDGACPDTTIKTIIVAPGNITATFTSDTVCFGTPTHFTDLSVGINSTTIYQWDFNSDGLVDDSTQGTTSYVFPNQAGVYSSTLIIYKDLLCPDTAQFNIYVDSTTVHADFITDTVCLGNVTNFTNVSIGVTSTTTYDWDINNDNVPDFTSATGVFFTFPTTGSFLSTLILNKNAICPDTTTQTVVVDSLGSISGQITNSSGIITSGSVRLYKDVAVGTKPLIDSVAINSFGNYNFKNVLPAKYIIEAYADTLQYPLTIATYFDSTYQWSNAISIDALCDTVINIKMLELSLLNGIGTVSGTIISIDTLSKKAGGPIPGVNVSLEQIPGGIVANTQSDDNGFYSFNNIPVSDSSYTIYVDLPGLPLDSTYTITVTLEDSLFEYLDYFVDSNRIFIIGAGGTTTISELVESNFVFSTYPNPFSDNLIISIILKEDSQVSIEAYNVLGSRMRIIENSKLYTGKYFFDFTPNENTTSSGVYFIKLKVGQGVPHLFKVIQAYK